MIKIHAIMQIVTSFLYVFYRERLTELGKLIYDT